MRKKTNWIDRDLAHVWHPCTQMKDHENFPPIEISSAKGSYLHSSNGAQIIDGISSWWCKSLGHRHPAIARAIKRQMKFFEHIIPAGTTQRPLVELSERLCSLMPGFDKVFYSDSGSSAVEVAAKMSLQFHAQTSTPEKKLLASLQNGYHGETTLALSLGDCELYSRPFSKILHRTIKLGPLPYLDSKASPLWEKIPDEDWLKVERTLDTNKPRLAAIFFEPIVQGAAGMLVYSMNFLQRLSEWAGKNNVLLVADEIMTGFHRTGPALACMHAGIVPDIVCLSKGLSAGWGAMSAVLVKRKIFNAFYDDHPTGKAFLHSSTYAGNALCAAAAIEALKIYEEERIGEMVSERECELRGAMEKTGRSTAALRNIRGIGFIAAADIVNPKTGSPFPKDARAGFMFYQNALRGGAFLRSLGDTIYFMPPLNSAPATIRKLAKIAAKALEETVRKLSS